MTAFNPVNLNSLLNRVSLASSQKKNAFLPLFEAVQNSINAIEAKLSVDSTTGGRIDLHIMRDENDRIQTLTISDNGIGLDEDNFQAFITPYTDFNAKKGGRGFGRIIGHKVFSKISYVSTYQKEDKSYETRSFDFTTTYGDEISSEIVKTENSPCDTGTSVKLAGFRPEFSRHGSTELDTVAELLLQHFLSQLLKKVLPTIKLFDGKKSRSLGDDFTSLLHKEKDIQSFSIELSDKTTHTLKVSFLHLRKKGGLDRHTLFLLAHGRTVGEGRNIANLLGNIRLEDDNGKDIVLLCCVEGELLETKVNTERTSFDLPEKDVDEIGRQVRDLVVLDQKEKFEKLERVKLSWSNK